RCLPFEYHTSPEQTVTVRLNGHEAGTIHLRSGWNEERLLLPAAAARAGHNRLELLYRWALSPSRARVSPDVRPLAVAWDWIRLGAGAPVPGPVATADPGAGRLPTPVDPAVHYDLRLAGGESLRVESVEAAGGPARVSAYVEGEDRPATRIGSFDA